MQKEAIDVFLVPNSGYTPYRKPNFRDNYNTAGTLKQQDQCPGLVCGVECRHLVWPDETIRQRTVLYYTRQVSSIQSMLLWYILSFWNVHNMHVSSQDDLKSRYASCRYCELFGPLPVLYTYKVPNAWFEAYLAVRAWVPEIEAFLVCSKWTFRRCLARASPY